MSFRTRYMHKVVNPLCDKCNHSSPLLLSAVTKILTLFMKTFIKSREEDEKQAKADKKKLEKDATKEAPLAKKDNERC